MSRYAKINSGSNIVDNIIVCEDSQINLLDGTFVKIILESTKECSVGYSYDAENNKFISPKPYDSWVLDENFEWISPIGENPNPALKCWDEESQNWIDRS
jgi:hypothetical protein